MALLNISAAARAVGKDRTTLHRKLKSGALSATVMPGGQKRIDTAELERVFGALVATGNATPQATPQATPPNSAHAAIVELLQEQLAEAKTREREAREREAWLQRQVEQEREARHALEVKLLPVMEVNLSVPNTWWRRMFGLYTGPGPTMA